MIIGVILLAFIGGAAMIFGVNLLYADLQRARLERLQEQIQRESRLVQRERAHLAVANQHLQELAASSSEDVARRKSARESLALYFDQSGVRLRPANVAILSLTGAAIAGGGAWLLTRNWLYVATASLACGALPSQYVVVMRRRRMRRLLAQLPDAFDLISRMMRAGRTFPQAMQATAEDGAPPLSEEFGYCSDQQQLGMSPNAALRDMSRRIGLLELKIFVLAVAIHRQSGGNLSDLLEKLADVIRARQQTRGLIGSLTAEGRMQIYVLTALPALALLVMTFVSPQNARELYDRPLLLVSTAVGMFLGWVWMKRIVDFSY